MSTGEDYKKKRRIPLVQPSPFLRLTGLKWGLLLRSRFRLVGINSVTRESHKGTRMKRLKVRLLLLRNSCPFAPFMGGHLNRYV